MLDATVVHQFGAEEYPPYGGVVIFNGHGEGKLRVVYGPLPEFPELGDAFLLLDKVPLVHWQENGCPTCERLLQAATGSPTEAAIWAKDVNELTLDQVTLGGSAWLARLRPLLHLLETGFYAVTLDYYYPTDGDGKLFWGERSGLRTCKALSEHVEGDVPAFLVATQPTASFRAASLDAAWKNKETHPGIAHAIGGRVSALLDGHHRALAAAIDRTTFPCVTVRGLWPYFVECGTVSMHVFGELYLDTNRMPSEAKEWIKNCSNRVWDERTLSSGQIAEFLKEGTPVSSSLFPQNLSIPDVAAVYPTDKMFGSLLRIAGPKRLVSDTLIDGVFTRGNRHFADGERAIDLLYALTVLGDKRAIGVARRISKEFHWLNGGLDAYRFLAARRSEDVDDFFVEFLIDDDGSRPEIKAVIDDYFRGQS